MMNIDWTIPVIVLQLIFLECILSIDNAAVLGALVLPLPNKKSVEWPKALQALGKALHPVLGNQRTAALRVGLLGAYLGRGLMLALASFVISNPWLKLVGAAYLVRLAFDSLGSSGGGDEEEGEEGRQVEQVGFWSTVLTLNLMDLAFSVDNVVAAVSLSDKLWVVMLGVAIGILTMRFAAGAFSFLIEKEPILKQAAYILVFNIGVELLLEDLGGLDISDWTRFGISIGTIVLALTYAHIPFLRVVFRPVLIWVAMGFSRINAIIDWLLIPLKAIVNFIWRLTKKVFNSSRKTTES